jgi:hypothetical protein
MDVKDARCMSTEVTMGRYNWQSVYRVKTWSCFVKGHIGGRMCSLSFTVNAFDAKTANEMLMDQVSCAGMVNPVLIEMEERK